MRRLARMLADMIRQVFLPRETLLTVRAFVRGLARVLPHMVH